MAGDNDPFDTLFTLEDQYYRDGFVQGEADGARAGRIEGRVFGYEKAFEKFVRVGRLHGRAIVLQERVKPSTDTSRLSSPIIPAASRSTEGGEASVEAATGGSTSLITSVSAAPTSRTPAKDGLGQHKGQPQPLSTSDGEARNFLPPLPHSQRLAKHIDALHALTEPPTFSTQNDEDAVADLDDRLRRAEAKAKLIDRMLGIAGDAHPVRTANGQGQSGLGTDAGKPSADMEEFVMRLGKARTAG